MLEQVFNNMKPETITLILQVLLIYIVHTFDAFLTYIGLKWGSAREVNPMINWLVKQLELVPALVLVQIWFTAAAVYAFINALYADYYNWYAQFGSWYFLLIQAMLLTLLVIRTVVVVWNILLLSGALPGPRKTPQLSVEL